MICGSERTGTLALIPAVLTLALSACGGSQLPAAGGDFPGTAPTTPSAPAAAVEAAAARLARSLPEAGGSFDYYVLALSWAPSYCLTHPNDGDECGSRGYGFVLHGLWPQYERGGYPDQCGGDAQLSRAAQQLGATLYPSRRLLGHEWRKHGLCTGLSDMDYLRTADAALAAVKIPAQFEPPASSQTTSAAQVIDLFRSANRQLPAEAVTLSCENGELSEVRICLSKNLQPRACAADVRTHCGRGGQVNVPGER